MKIETQTLLLLQDLAPQQQGIFSTSDLKALFGTSRSECLNQKLEPLLEAKILQRFCRGFYITPSFNLRALSRRLCADSVISLGTVLADEMLIGSVPTKTVYAVKIGKSRLYKSSLGQVVHLGLSSAKGTRDMSFGYGNFKGGIQYADKERAFLDTLYFYQLGHKFSFNIYSDIQTDRLDVRRLKDYLDRYENPKFKTFVHGVINGQHSI